jgi:hypothetical protein
MLWIAKLAPLFRLVEKIEPYTKERAEEVGATWPEDIVYDNPLMYYYVIIGAMTKKDAENEAYAILGVE